jgi:hypothetical protein
VALLLVWVTFPGGGVYPLVWIPAALATVLLTAGVRPRVLVDARSRAVDLFLMLATLTIAVQLIPLPYSILQRIDPHIVPLRVALWLMPPAAASQILRLPISIVPRETGAALAIFGAAALLFWTCRQICEGGGTGRIVQRAESKELLYGLWKPQDAGARPYGPFVNRNHFATWVIMACPLVFGYLLARAPAARDGQLLSQRFVSALKQLGSIRIWLASAVCLMMLAALISTSRSGIIGLVGAFAVSTWLSRGRHQPHTRRWSIFQAVLLALVILSFASFDSLISRFDETIAQNQSGRGRIAVWQDAERLIRDFRWTGTGAGTFGTAIIGYQTAEPEYSIGQAHNHYLQLAAEGGVLMVVPAVLVLGSFLLLFRRRLEEDASSDFLIRAGAVAGLAGVLLQSFWETGLRMPANAMLFAVLAAIATHTPSHRSSSSHRTH